MPRKQSNVETGSIFGGMELSFWEKSTYFDHLDLVVVGGGIVGLNTARAAKELHPEWKIMVIDRGFLPYGASTRNAGFACFGSISELTDDLQRMTEDEVFGLVERRYRGLCRLRELLGDAALGYEGKGGYEVFTTSDRSVFEDCNNRIDYFNTHLEHITGQANMYRRADDDISRFGFAGVEHLLLNQGEGQINTGSAMQALLALVRSKGIEMICGLGIEKIEETTSGALVRTTEGFHFKCRQVVVTTNAFARELLPELVVQPGRAQVLVTKPIEGLKLEGTFHYDKGYFYFRNVGNRILFGGGRNLDFQGEETTEFGLTDLIQDRLDQLLRDVIAPYTSVEAEVRWSGIMGLGPVKTTIVQRVSTHIVCAVRMGGMGVAIGSLVGEEAAQLLHEH